jgi:hypothetical protein
MSKSSSELVRTEYEGVTHVSNVLWHFIGPKRHETLDKAIERLDRKIFRKGGLRGRLKPFFKNGNYHVRDLLLEPLSYGPAGNPQVKNNWIIYEPKSLCFCDIPVNHLPLHMSKYGDVGLGFRREIVLNLKDCIVKPVRYFPLNPTESIKRQVADIGVKGIRRGVKTLHLDNFIKIPTWLPPGKPNIEGSNAEDFNSIYEEREWRTFDEMEFKTEDLSFILLPSKKYISKKYPNIYSAVQKGVGK